MNRCRSQCLYTHIEREREIDRERERERGTVYIEVKEQMLVAITRIAI